MKKVEWSDVGAAAVVAVVLVAAVWIFAVAIKGR
jgi:hypothetical protein